jgi:protein SCO1
MKFTFPSSLRSESGSVHRAVYAAIGLAMLSLVAVFLFAPKRTIDRLVLAPDFRFEKMPKGELSRQDLLGQVWVAGFIFTTCKGICPVLSQKMQNLEAKFGGGPDFRLVSFTIDPKNDTPEVLEKYRNQWSRVPGSWHFLRPTREQLVDFATGLKLVVGDVGDFTHTSRLVLVDKRGWVRGYYQATDDEQLSQLGKDVRLLIDE